MLEFLVAALVLLAIVLGVAGVAFSSQATIGSSLVAFACLLAIMARIAQAGSHRR